MSDEKKRPTSEKRDPKDRREDREHRGLRDMARRLFREGDGRPEAPREGEEGEDGPEREEGWGTREMLIAALATGDKAKAEIVRLLAREFRSYLEALELHKDLHHLLTNYSLEVHASLSLKPKEGAEESAVKLGLKPKDQEP